MAYPPRVHEVSAASTLQETARNLALTARRGALALVRGVAIDSSDELARFAASVGDVIEPMDLPGVRASGSVLEIQVNGQVTRSTNWHHDHSFLAVPPDWSILYCVDPGSENVPTVFADGCAIADLLSPGLRGVLQQMTATHHAYYPADGVPESDALASASHPVLVRVEGGEAVFVSPAMVTRFDDWYRDDSQALLRIIFGTMNWPEVTTTHYWNAGDLLLWPNRRFAHRALPLETGSSRSLMRVFGTWGT